MQKDLEMIELQKQKWKIDHHSTHPANPLSIDLNYYT